MKLLHFKCFLQTFSGLLSSYDFFFFTYNHFYYVFLFRNLNRPSFPQFFAGIQKLMIQARF